MSSNLVKQVLSTPLGASCFQNVSKRYDDVISLWGEALHFQSISRVIVLSFALLL